MTLNCINDGTESCQTCQVCDSNVITSIDVQDILRLIECNPTELMCTDSPLDLQLTVIDIIYFSFLYNDR